jgi:hypothetical protein
MRRKKLSREELIQILAMGKIAENLDANLEVKLANYTSLNISKKNCSFLVFLFLESDFGV